MSGRSNAKSVRRKRKVDPAKVDTAWLKAALEESGLSGRQLTKMLGQHQSWASRVINGLTAPTMTELTDLARVLNVTVEDLMPRFGIQTRHFSGTLALAVLVNENGEAVTAKGADRRSVDAPAGATAHTLAAQARTPDDAATDGWIFFYNQSNRVNAEAVGRLSFIKLMDGRQFVRVINRGYDRAKWTLRPLRYGSAQDIENVAVESASPILSIRC